MLDWRPINHDDLKGLHAFLEAHLLEDIVPFWLRHAVDKKNGGLFTCINDDGTLQSREKYMWSQTRALWTFSALYRRIRQDTAYLDVARGLFEFCRKFGRDDKGYWVFTTDEAGAVLTGENSIVTDAFAILGMVEYGRVTGDPEAGKIALETYDAVCERLNRPHTYRTAPYPTPAGMRPHREAMQFSLAFWELGTFLTRPDIRGHGLKLGREVLDHFYCPEKKALLEYIGMDSLPQDTPEGRTLVPGHGVESSYFQILLFASENDKARVRTACNALRDCLERGWDPEYGGLFLGMDIEGKTPVYWKNNEMKLWWPHAESLAGTLLAYERTREPWALDWYWKIHDWSFARFPVQGHGEWTQRLDRKGNKIDTVVALPVKDPFHLPRGLILSIEALERIHHRSNP